jgi:hypothetical protein
MYNCIWNLEKKRKIITYRSYKNVDTDSFNCDLENISFPDIENLSTSSEVRNVYNEYQNAFKSVLDKHAPV